MADPSEATQAVAHTPGEVADPHIELQVFTAQGSESRLPFLQSCLILGEGGLLPLAPGQSWKAEVNQRGGVVFARLTGDEAGLCRGEEVVEATLVAGDCLELGTTRIWVLDARQPPLASLEVYNGEGSGRIWNLRRQPYCVGRTGAARVNHIELQHPTVSRIQATFLPCPKGGFLLMAESPTSPVQVNGKRIEAQAVTSLHHGDLIQLGDLLLRYRDSSNQSAGRSLFCLRTLGTFEPSLGDQSFPSSLWKSEKAKWLLARLGVAWGQPLGVEALMESLWPDLPSLRGRKNLSQCLGSIRQTLNLNDEEDELFLRSSANLQLNPGRLGEHDYIQVQSLLASAQGKSAAEVSAAALEKAFELYQGEFLPGCYDDWAISAREDLLAKLVPAACLLAEHYRLKQKFDAAIAAAQRGLALDNCSQENCQVAMEALIGAGRPQDAIRLFEQLRGRLRQELDVEPTTELLRLHQRARLV